jgi:hypothetical protein
VGRLGRARCWEAEVPADGEAREAEVAAAADHPPGREAPRRAAHEDRVCAAEHVAGRYERRGSPPLAPCWEAPRRAAHGEKVAAVEHDECRAGMH